uniref:Uncharacterized protein n=1 Tax=Mus spicilegus TaxID=10103 RepID=A0A8C6HLR2_MUSSI
MVLPAALFTLARPRFCYLRMGVSFKSSWRACFLSHLLVSPCSVKEKANGVFVTNSIKRTLVKAAWQLPSLSLQELPQNNRQPGPSLSTLRGVPEHILKVIPVNLWELVFKDKAQLHI